jgi:hypothetical protein
MQRYRQPEPGKRDADLFVRPSPLCYRRRPAPVKAAPHIDQRNIVATLIAGLALSAAGFWIVTNSGF